MSGIDRIARALLAGKPGGPHPGGIHVYHSSPHDFDKFDWSKLRTGEGANVYGSGFYFAENPAVSGQGGQYWNQFLGRFSGPEEEAAQILKYTGFDRAKAIELLNKRAGRKEVSDPSSLVDQVNEIYANTTRKAAGLLERGAPVGPRTYEVNINARPELMLDWDKPMPTMGRYWGNGEETAGAVLQRANRSPIHAGDLLGVDSATPEQLSKGLAERGIPGIRYLDEGSRAPVHPDRVEAAKVSLDLARQRGDQEGLAYWQQRLADFEKPPSYNYVVTDPSKLDILAKYGVVGGAPIGMGALAARDQYGEARQ